MLTFGHLEQYHDQVRQALSTTMHFTSFAPGSAGGPSEDELRAEFTGRPSVYAIPYMADPPASHPEWDRIVGTAHGGGFLYVGKTTDTWRRFRQHSGSLGQVCGWSDGPRFEDFWFFAMSVNEPWEIHSFEALTIAYLRPIFNDVAKGLGAGGTGDFYRYVADPTTMSSTDRAKRSEIQSQAASAIDDSEKSPLVWYDEDEPPTPPATLAAWLEEMDRST